MRVLICAVVLVYWLAGFAQPPEPKALLSAIIASYTKLQSFSATVQVSTKVAEAEIPTRLKVWYSAPFARIEWETEIEGGPVLEIYDCGNGRRWLLYQPNYWEEEEIQTPCNPLDLLGVSSLAQFEPVSLSESIVDGKQVWVMEGFFDRKAATIWVDKVTNFLLVYEVRGKAFGIRTTFEEFTANIELPLTLFEKPKPEEIAAIFKLSWEGMQIVSEIQKKFAEMKSWVARKSVETAWGEKEEELVYWRYPFLRIERRTAPSPWFGSETIWAYLFDFSAGVVYEYFGEGWEKSELYEESPELTAVLVFFMTFNLMPSVEDLVPVAASQITAVSEETLGTRKVWRLTGRGERGGPPPEWWVDQETFLVVQYTEPMRIKRIGEEEWTWELEKVRIISFETNVEIPDDVFAAPKNVKEQRPLELWLKGSETEGAELGPGLSWEPFSFEKVEEALANGKTVVIFFTAEWCDPCHVLEEGPLRDKRVTELLEPLVRLKVDLSDFKDRESAKISELFKVRGIPSFVFLGPDGKELGRITGYASVSSLVAEIKRILLGGEK